MPRKISVAHAERLLVKINETLELAKEVGRTEGRVGADIVRNKYQACLHELRADVYSSADASTVPHLVEQETRQALQHRDRAHDLEKLKKEREEDEAKAAAENRWPFPTGIRETVGARL